MRAFLYGLAVTACLTVGITLDTHNPVCRTEDSVRCVWLPHLQGNMQGQQPIIINLESK
jgi:hypothetical protein